MKFPAIAANIAHMGIEVVPLRVEQAVTLLTEPEEFAGRFGLTLVDGFLAFPEALEPTVEALEGGIAPAWFAHLIVEGTQVVGLGGYTGPPVDGVIEIGYSVAPSCQGRGIATAAVGQWLDRAAGPECGASSPTPCPRTTPRARCCAATASSATGSPSTRTRAPCGAGPGTRAEPHYGGRP